MINFPCHSCGETLSVPIDLAGGDIQCPTCGRLTSVPLLSDLPNLRPDGTLAIGPVIDRQESDRLQGLARTFGRRRFDDDGEAVDNRTMPDAIDLAPLPPPPTRYAPLYDPETGERMDPLELKREPPVAALPLGPLDRAGPPVAHYATPGKTSYARGAVWLELFSPGNAFVIFLLFMAHVVWALIDMFIVGVLKVAILAGGPALASWPMNIFFWLALAHYANVIFATGEEEHDAVPRPLRNLGFFEDVFQPLVQFLIAFIVCFAPAWAAGYLPVPMAGWIYAALLAAGGLVFPAALLAACGSNTLANLSPGRLLNVIRAGGWPYLRLALLTTLVVPLYAWSVAGLHHLVLPLVRGNGAAPIAAHIWESFVLRIPIMFLVVVVAHGICWRLGQLQRLHRAEFGWAWEQHEADRLAERRRRQAEREAAARRRISGVAG